ncbi:hypothetical protein Aph02nite_52860 [Actinoplanes philippinensis]|uniref:Uncharacterized protein n=1 Tax=Actinoplanes philippinensis TaxID=35752 RepID=A0A1I2IHZ4_9ACTN|nr:hypothetical protein [Actinoplanes philippinensis]GIE79336.1 hypothetical protein Aph02nite_52860 [Actinoplanes philippinensis]SFF41945.1 hypothetical protein SAMN05421541_11073 [Actinoplanes philippinensis]
MNLLLRMLGVVVALFFVVRAVAEPFVIDVTDPSTYANDWGGPSLAGVLAVHCGPGILAAMFLYGSVVRWRTARTKEPVSSAR